MCYILQCKRWLAIKSNDYLVRLAMWRIWGGNSLWRTNHPHFFNWPPLQLGLEYKIFGAHFTVYVHHAKCKAWQSKMSISCLVVRFRFKGPSGSKSRKVILQGKDIFVHPIGHVCNSYEVDLYASPGTIGFAPWKGLVFWTSGTKGNKGSGKFLCIRRTINFLYVYLFEKLLSFYV